MDYLLFVFSEEYLTTKIVGKDGWSPNEFYPDNERKNNFQERLCEPRVPRLEKLNKKGHKDFSLSANLTM